MDYTQIAVGGLSMIGAGLLSFGIFKGRMNGIEKAVDDHDKKLNGNGQEGLIVKVTRIETKIDEIKERLE